MIKQEHRVGIWPHLMAADLLIVRCLRADLTSLRLSPHYATSASPDFPAVRAGYSDPQDPSVAQLKAGFFGFRPEIGLSGHANVADVPVSRHLGSMNTQAETHLSEAVELVYHTFASPTPAAIEGCPCCILTRGDDVLLTTPLRELSGQQLWRYVSGAFLTIGGEDDFRYLLPRILDISANDPANANDPEIVIGKLALANWRKWSAPEQRAIEQFLDAWFDWALVNDVAEADAEWIGTDAESVLCGAARAGLPLDGWLFRLHDPLAAPVLADLKRRFPKDLSPFWEDMPDDFRKLSTILAQGQA